MQNRLSIPLASLLVLALGACADPVTSPERGGAAVRFAAAASEAKSSLDLIETDLDAGLLDREHANRYRQYAVSAPSKLPAKYRSRGIGKDATYSMVRLARDWDALSPATQQEILDLRAKGFGTLQETRETAHFVLHYTTQGNHAVPVQDGDGNGTPDFIDVAMQSLERSWTVEVAQLGYPAPIGTPAQKMHIYYQDMAYYGYCSPIDVQLLATSPVYLGTAAAYMVVENDFQGFPYNDEDRTGTETVRSGALKVTHAHEFMHAVQFAINVYQGGWLMESHATWAEDAVYGGVNDWHWYVPSFLATPDYPLFSRYLYGAAFFQHWLAETRGPDVLREVWLAARYASAADAVRSVAFGGSWEGIKAFAPAEYLLDLEDWQREATTVVPNPQNRIRAAHATYPVSVAVGPSTNRTANRAPWGTGANFIEFTSSASGTLTLTFDGEDGFAWRAFAIATPLHGGGPVLTELVLDAGSAGSATIAGLGTRFARVTLAPTIAGREGAEVPYAYGATLATAVAGK
jgi:hypothetical protein